VERGDVRLPEGRRDRDPLLRDAPREGPRLPRPALRAKLLVADPSARGELDRLEAEVEVLTLDEARLEEEPDRAEAASAPALRPRAEP
jgi:hypothetical protein